MGSIQSSEILSSRTAMLLGSLENFYPGVSLWEAIGLNITKESRLEPLVEMGFQTRMGGTPSLWFPCWTATRTGIPGPHQSQKGQEMLGACLSSSSHCHVRSTILGITFFPSNLLIAGNTALKTKETFSSRCIVYQPNSFTVGLGMA